MRQAPYPTRGGVAVFTLSPSTKTTGITTMGEIEVAPARIVRRFGPPAPGDGYKVSGEFVFVGENDELFVVHDWKSTSLWEEDLLPPKVFWAGEEPQELNIGSRDVDTTAFEQWFLQQLQGE